MSDDVSEDAQHTSDSMDILKLFVNDDENNNTENVQDAGSDNGSSADSQRSKNNYYEIYIDTVNKLEDAEKKVRELQAILNNERDEFAELLDSKITAEEDVFKKEIDEKNCQINELRSCIDVMTVENQNEINQLTQSISELKLEYENKIKLIENATMSNIGSRIDELRESCSILKRELELMRSSQKALLDEIQDDLICSNNRTKTVIDENNKLKFDYSQLVSEKEFTELVLKEKLDHILKLEEELTKLRNEVTTLRGSGDLNAKISSLTTLVNAQKSSILSLNSDIEGYKEQIYNLGTVIEQNKSLIREKEGRIAELEELLSQKTKQNDTILEDSSTETEETRTAELYLFTHNIASINPFYEEGFNSSRHDLHDSDITNNHDKELLALENQISELKGIITSQKERIDFLEKYIQNQNLNETDGQTLQTDDSSKSSDYSQESHGHVKFVTFSVSENSRPATSNVHGKYDGTSYFGSRLKNTQSYLFPNESENQDIQAQLKTAANNISALEHELDSERKLLQSYMKELSCVKNSYESLKNDYKRLESLNAELKAKLDSQSIGDDPTAIAKILNQRNHELQVTKQTAQEIIRKKKARIAELKQFISELKGKLAESAKLIMNSKNNEEFRKELEVHLANEHRLQRKVNVLKEKLTMLAAGNPHILETIKEKDNEISRLKNEVEKFRTYRSSAHTETDPTYAKLRTRAETAEADVQTLTKLLMEYENTSKSSSSTTDDGESSTPDVRESPISPSTRCSVDSDFKRKALRIIGKLWLEKLRGEFPDLN